MNSLFTTLGLGGWKPLLTALILPPVPFLLLILIGARLLLPRRGLGWLVVLLGVAGTWLCGCYGTAMLLDRYVLHVPMALGSDRIAELRTEARKGGLAIVVLGGGVEPLAPEYGVSNLAAYSMERLRYGVWLGRETGAPVAFSGGVGWAQGQSGSEADAAARIAAQEFNRPLKWTENESRDTRENAMGSVAMLRQAGVTHVLLVTHGWHMPRAKRNFETAADGNGAEKGGIRIEAAPMGLARRIDSPALDWIPTTIGITRVRNALRECFGLWVGA